MRTFNNIYLFALALLLLTACEDDERSLGFLDTIPLPSEIGASFKIEQDNSGVVTISPTATGANSFTVDFGDGSPTSPVLKQGESVQHTYDEGTFQIGVTAENLKGQSASSTIPLTVNFKAPENLMVNLNVDGLNATVSATADFEAYFEVDFGEDPEADPIQFMEGETAEYTYQSVGTFVVTVTAFSGGSNTAVFTDTIMSTDPVVLPISFESTTRDIQFGDFGGATTELIGNPDPSGINTSSTVARLNKMDGSETFAGTSFPLNEPIDFSAGDKFRIKTWSPTVGAIVKLKIENLEDGSISTEVDAVTTVANQWEELLFDFSGQDLSQPYGRLVIFFDFGNSGMGEDYYFDDIVQSDQGLEPLALPLTFESTQLTYNFVNFGGATTTVVANPDMNGNTSATVANLNKESGSEVWAGSFIELPDPIDFSTSSEISVKTWAPASGITVMLKVENATDGGIFIEVPVTNTVANEWETLTFDFSSGDLSQEYHKVVMFFDFGNAGTGADYYFDDVRFVGDDPGDVLALPIDFESQTLSYVFEGFGSASAMVVANPDMNGNPSATVANLNKANGSEVWAGAFIELPDPIDFSTSSQISVKTWAPASGITIMLKVENATDGGIFIEVPLTNTVANEWETLTYDFSGGDLSQEYHKVVMFFDFGNNGTGADYYFDDIEFAN